MPSWTETDVAVDGARLRAYRTGRPGAPVVVLAHGLTDNARYWARTVEALQADYDLALYDARGHGQSSAPPPRFDDDRRARDLWQVVDALSLSRPVLIGHSMGAATVAAAAALRPGAARAVVLEDPPWLDPPPTEPELRAFMANWKTDLLALKALPREAALAARRAEDPDWAEADCHYSVDAKLAADPAVLDAYARSDTPWRATVQRIDCPLLLFTGEPARGAYVTAAAAREVLALAPAGARWVHLAGASHSARYSRFDAYLQALHAFLQSL